MQPSHQTDIVINPPIAARHRRYPADDGNSAFTDQGFERGKCIASELKSDALIVGDLGFVQKGKMRFGRVEYAAGLFVQVVCGGRINQRSQAVTNEMDRLAVART